MESLNSPSLLMRINNEVQSSRFPRGSKALFAPRTVPNIIDQDTIIRHMDDSEKGYWRGFQESNEFPVWYIVNNLKELFAIFVAISMPPMVIITFIRVFQERGVTDRQIPQIDEIMERFPQLNVFQVWKQHLNNQRYMFRAPVFSQNLRTKMTPIHSDIPLPIYFCHTKTWTGGFGTVYRVRIHHMFEGRFADEVRLSCMI